MHTGTQATSYGNMKLDRNEGYWGQKKRRFLHFYENFFYIYIYIATHGREKLEKLEQWEVFCVMHEAKVQDNIAAVQCFRDMPTDQKYSGSGPFLSGKKFNVLQWIPEIL